MTVCETLRRILGAGLPGRGQDGDGDAALASPANSPREWRSQGGLGGRELHQLPAGEPAQAVSGADGHASQPAGYPRKRT